MSANLTSRILDARGDTVFQQAQTVPAVAFTADAAAEFRLELPLARLGPGLYLLTIEIRAGQDSAQQSVTFTVN